ncbi:hypothetical protein [Paucibacter sp. Y2R2-4]|uniref:hypothetical protein n=1 Tax=Paucibacter sp. Y2R2-4 TaxID=2893553 RepID=UPI0021E3B202|nr:hypothetical protein [Paucibacter sp. Y2R2-4]MCV2352284.1 hypothetical protein [Paucibacter sp. Y2R2-4]
MSANTKSFSPSSNKPALAVADWIKCGLSVDVVSFDPATEEQVKRAHSPAYVDGIMRCELPNGFGNRSREVADSLPYTVGSMVAAATHALEHGGIACSPSSGFHHARYAEAGDYCTFNGLMVAALEVMAQKPGARIAIVDFDMHYGDGTDDIRKRLGLQKSICHIRAGLEVDEGMGRYFMSSMTDMLLSTRDYFGRAPDLVLYQAGADQHIKDPLGGLLTTAEMKRRDEYVLQSYARWGVPVAFNLAGGYQTDEAGTIEPVLKLHRQTMEEATRAQGFYRQ